MQNSGRIHLYYAYYDDDNQLYYYYDTETEKTSWIYPKDGLVKDPDTFKTFANPDILFPSIRSSISSKILKPNEDSNQEIHLVVDLDEKVIKFIDQSSVHNLIKEKNNQIRKNNGEINNNTNQNEKVNQNTEQIQDNNKNQDEIKYQKEAEASIEEESKNEEESSTEEEDQDERPNQNPEQYQSEETNQSTEQYQSEEANQNTEQYQSEETGQSYGQFQSEETNQSTEQYQSEETNQSAEQYQSEETNQSAEQYQSEETNQSTEQYQSEETNQSTEQYQSEETNQTTEQYQSEETNQSSEQLQNELEMKSNDDQISQIEEKISNNSEVKHNAYIPPDDIEPHFLPRAVSDEIHKYQAASFAKRHFQKNVNGQICRRTSITMEDLVLFSKTPLTSPLLSNLTDDSRKNALKCFRLILQATGVSSSGRSSTPTTAQTINDSSIVNPGNSSYFTSPLAVDIIISMLYEDESLIDEVYFQLMKQTNQCPRIDWLIQTWNLFLVIASIFPSTKESELWIKSFLMKNIADENKEIGILVQFILIRFNIRCSIGQSIERIDLLVDKNKSMPNEKQKKMKKKAPYINIFNFYTLFNCTSIFRVSLYEIMWSQRISYPNCPIPIFLHNVCQCIIEKNAFNIEGVFRLPGNMKEVTRMSNEPDLSMDKLREAKLHDLCSLLKMWIRDLSEPIIPYQYTGTELCKAYEQGRIIEYVSSFPRLHSLTLAYLIGFLQIMATHEDNTKMGPSNLAIVFAPNIVRQNIRKKVDSNSYELISVLAAQKESANMSNEIIERLIVDWDVSAVYPMSEEVFQHS